MPIPISELDRHIEFLREEAFRLSRIHMSWADQKSQKLEQIAEVLRRVRQDQQMTGMGGRIG